MRATLRLKHWQLFILIFLFGAWTSPNLFGTLVNLIAVIVGLVWLYSVAFFGYRRILQLGLTPPNFKLFRISCFILGSYFLSIIIKVLPINREENFVIVSGSRTYLLQLLGILVLFAIVYTVLFVCKTIAILEHKRPVVFDDYVKYLFQTFFFCFGIWFLQPKITKLIALDLDSGPASDDVENERMAP